MWNNKLKAFTLSYDDGVMQDKRIVKIFNKYNLKCTFNINSAMMYNECVWNCKGTDVIRMTAEECMETFKGHEIASHTLTHPNLAVLDDNQLIRQLMGDKKNLERFFKTEINGMAYPGGFYDKRCEDAISQCNMKYARTVASSHNFEISENLLELKPTSKHTDDDVLKLIDDFVSLKPQRPQLFYLWGHSYEFDVDNNWELIEEICRRISGKDDIYYGTNHEVLSTFYK